MCEQEVLSRFRSASERFVLRSSRSGTDSCFGFRVSGLKFRVSGFGFRVSVFGFRVSGFGFRFQLLGFGFRREF